MKRIFIAVLFLLSIKSFGQVGIGTTNPDSSAVLELKSTNKGMLMPRMSASQRLAIAAPAKGLLVFDTTSKAFYFYADTSWLRIGDARKEEVKYDIVNDVNALMAYSGIPTIISVVDTIRGGLFVYNQATATADSGVIFPATGKGSGNWRRIYEINNGVNIAWYGVTSGANPKDNARWINKAVQRTNNIIYGNFRDTISLSAKISLDKGGIYFRNFSFRLADSANGGVPNVFNVFEVSKDSVFLENITCVNARGTNVVSEQARRSIIKITKANFFKGRNIWAFNVQQHLVLAEEASNISLENIFGKTLGSDLVRLSKVKYAYLNNLWCNGSVTGGALGIADSSHFVFANNLHTRNSNYVGCFISSSASQYSTNIFIDKVLGENNNSGFVKNQVAGTSYSKYISIKNVKLDSTPFPLNFDTVRIDGLTLEDWQLQTEASSRNKLTISGVRNLTISNVIITSPLTTDNTISIDGLDSVQKNLDINNLMVNNNDITGTSKALLRVRNFDHVNITNCKLDVKNDVNYGMLIENCRNVNLTGNITRNSSTYGIYISNESQTDSNFIIMANNTMNTAGLLVEPKLRNVEVIGNLGGLTNTTPTGKYTSNFQNDTLAVSANAISLQGQVILKAGTSGLGGSPMRFRPGSLLTTPVQGAVEYDGNIFYLTPGTTRKRIALTNNLAPSGGRIPIGNGTDFTVANITGTLPVTVNSSSGSIVVGLSGLNGIGSPGQLLRVNPAGNGLEYFTPNYLTVNPTITLTGDVTGVGTTNIVTSLKDTGTADTYYSRITTDSKGRVVSGVKGVVFPIAQVKTQDYILTQSDHTVPVDATAGNITVTLPGTVLAGTIYNIKKVTSDNSVIIDPEGSATIDGQPNLVLSGQWEKVRIQFDGTNYLTW
jgi:hypothetical protein